MIKPKILVTDGDCHWYIIPQGKLSDWAKYLIQMEKYEADLQDAFEQNLDLTEIVEPEFPKWVFPIDSPHHIIIYEYAVV